MHKKCFKIDFFINFRKLQKKLPICKKRYGKILNVARAVVTSVEKNEKRRNIIFFGLHLDEQSHTSIYLLILAPGSSRGGPVGPPLAFV